VRKALGILLTSLLVTQTLMAQQPLGITRVLLYKNGMAYIVRSGQITAPVSLTFHPEDMNDILKSFTAWNPDTGSLYSVGYTAGIPSSHMLSRFPFDLSGADTGLGGFLIQVKGAEVKLDHSGKDLQGKLVAVQQTDHATAPQTVSSDYRLTVLLRDGSLQSVWLSDVRSVEFVDPQLRDQLRSYLEVLAAGRQDVTREVSVYPVPGPGPIQVAYLQQFPLWKTSYRVDLGAKDSKIQGEGDYEAARRYEEASKRYAESGKAPDAAKKASPGSPQEAEDMRRAEEEGKSHAKGEDPQVHNQSGGGGDAPAKSREGRPAKE